MTFPKSMTKMVGAHRCEQMVLQHFRLNQEFVTCSACPKKHTEWVRVPVSKVQTVAEMYSAWMRSIYAEEAIGIE